MQLRFWVYRRNLSNDPRSPFRSNGDAMRKAGCCISGFLGFVFLCMALFSLFSPQAHKDRNMFLIFMGFFGIFEVICLLYSCIPYFYKYCKRSDGGEQYEGFSNSLLTSEENSYRDIPGYQVIGNSKASASYEEFPSYQAGPSYREAPIYQAGPSYREAPSYQAGPSYREAPSYQAGPSYREAPSYQAGPSYREVPNYQSFYGAEGGYFPGLACFRPLVNYEGVFHHQQIPIYQQDLVEPQLPPYSPGYTDHIPSPQHDILVY